MFRDSPHLCNHESVAHSIDQWPNCFIVQRVPGNVARQPIEPQWSEFSNSLFVWRDSFERIYQWSAVCKMDFQICNLQRQWVYRNHLALPHMHRRRLRRVLSDSRELRIRFKAGEGELRQKFLLPWLGRWGPFLDLRGAWTRIPTLRTRGDIGTVQLSSQRNWQKRMATRRGVYRRPWEAIRVPEHVHLDANYVQRWAFRPKKVWGRQNC